MQNTNNTNNTDIRKLYSSLMNLCTDSTSKKIGGVFRFTDNITSLGTKVRIFVYELAGYSDFIIPDAQSCRGIMFEMDNEIPVRIMSRPMDKFFNYSELQGWNTVNLHVVGNMVMPSDIDYIMDKRDGSLISSYFDINKENDIKNVKLKSMGALYSDQANDASVWLYQPERIDLLEFVTRYAENDYTINFEWTAPNNQIVLCYKEPELRILNIRHNITGEYVDIKELLKDIVFAKYAVDVFAAPVVEPSDDIGTWVKSVYEMTGIEGYIGVTKSGQMFKIKTDWYSSLHRTKDSVNNNKALMLVCAENSVDDLKQMLRNDKDALYKIDLFYDHFSKVVNNLYQNILIGYNNNKHKERKDYAISMNRLFGAKTVEFIVAMNCHINKRAPMVDDIVYWVKKNPEKYIPDGYR